MLIDSHLHLVNEGYDIDKVVKKACEMDVDYLIVSGSEVLDNRLNMDLLDKYDNVFLSAGFHPCCAGAISDDDFAFLEEFIKNDRVVAIGEIGLDYYYGKDNKDAQKELFIRQLDFAVKYDMSVVIHTRDAFLDTYNILKEYNLKGVIHCFSGSLETALSYTNLGYYLGIGGVVTFKNSNLKDVVKEIGLSKIVLETDSPYLSPFRGKKNEPCNIRVICSYVADILGVSFDEVANVTTSNVVGLFDLNDKI